MKLEDLNYISAVHALTVDGEALDVIVLADGRVIAVDGENASLFDDLAALIDSEREDDDVERQTIQL